MPKGQKIVDWTNPQNDAKLLVAVLKHCDVSKVHDKIAKDFGDNVPASCISTRFAKIKKDFKGGKFASGSGTDTPTKAPRSATKAKQSNDKGRKKQNGEDNDTDMSMDDVDDEADQLVMPKTANGKDKVLNGRVTKARASPRKAAKKDYQKMADPLGAMKDVRDENGQPMFEDKGFTSEDSDPTDVEFGQAPRPKSKHQLVKQEEDEVL